MFKFRRNNTSQHNNININLKLIFLFDNYSYFYEIFSLLKFPTLLYWKN